VASYIDKKAMGKELDLEVILFIHKILLSNIRDDIIGRFRNHDGWVRIADHIGLDLNRVVEKLEESLMVTLAEYAKRKNISHSNLINKAHHQTIEAFYEKGIREIGYSD